MTQEEEWARLAVAATPGPWRVVADGSDGFYGHHPENYDIDAGDDSVAIGGVVEEGGPHIGACSKADAEFIAASRTAVPALLAEVSQLRAKIERVEALAEEMSNQHGQCWNSIFARRIRATLVDFGDVPKEVANGEAPLGSTEDPQA